VLDTIYSGFSRHLLFTELPFPPIPAEKAGILMQKKGMAIKTFLSSILFKNAPIDSAIKTLDGHQSKQSKLGLILACLYHYA